MSTTLPPATLSYLPSDALGWQLQHGPHRADNYWALPEGEPVELIRGELVMSPAPNFHHQVLSSLLTDIFLKAARKSKGLMSAAPVDVVLSEDSIVQPDLIYVTKARRKIVRERVEGPPDIAVEILSPGNARRDRVHKLTLYAEHGVAEVWLIDPVAKTFDFLLLGQEGTYQLTPGVGPNYTSPRCPELSIDIEVFWKDVAEMLDDDS